MNSRVLPLSIIAVLAAVTAYAVRQSQVEVSAPESAAAHAIKPLSAVERTLSNNPAVATAAIAQLRAQGPEGLRTLLAFRDAVAKSPGEDAKLEKLAAAIDGVSGQRYGSISHLYWYTDLAKAEAAAAASGKPILSLRLLGNLTDEYSCANSRFFRTTLYSNPEIADYLRDNFILHWKSERPVPRVTFDFGDGRVLERTLTGNSIHYVLGSDGRVLDGLPGLYSPEAFLGWLKSTQALAQKYNTTDDNAVRTGLLAEYHVNENERIAQAWAQDLRGIYGPAARFMNVRAVMGSVAAAPGAVSYPATAAMPIAATKSGVEQPMLARMDVGQPPGQLAGIEELQKSPVSDGFWKNIVARHPVHFDPVSLNLIRQLAAGGADTANAGNFESLLEKFQHSVALDTLRNEYTLHRTLHEWLGATAAEPADFEALNERVYAELFLTPSSDPWLGLAPDNVFAALPNNGVAELTR